MLQPNDRDYTYADRELSWISFNGRVLQEADDPTVPLFEGLAFLAIFSSNLDEFFRVRVASLRSLLRLKKKKLGKLRMNPRRLLREIHSKVSAQQERFGDIFRDRILPELAGHGIHLVDERSVSEEHADFVREYFRQRVRPLLDPVRLDPESPSFLEDRQVYLSVELWAVDEHGLAGRPAYALVKVPDELPRFVSLPESGDRREVMFLDDVIRFCLPELFPDADVGGAYAVKLSRDAELYIEDEFSGNVVDAIRKSLSKRETGVPARFLYDLQSPYAMVALLGRCLRLEDEDLILGGRYHNLHDFHGFPRFGLTELAHEPLELLSHPTLSARRPVHQIVSERDRIVHFPYQAFDPVVRFLEEAAADVAVEEVWATLYRVSEDSAVVRALLAAAEAGKTVRVFVEVKARFDEASNLRWAQRMEKAGIVTLYSFRDLKVHAKLALVARREGRDLRYHAYLGTGNFNEKTARIYADHGLLTADPRITEDVRRVFGILAGEDAEPAFEHLLVAPFTMRERFYEMIEREATHAREGRPAGMVLKMNGLEDEGIIRRLYDASNAGVPIRLIVRGICRLVPQVPGQSENITATSIVDRHLEHARVFVFRNGGENAYYLASADWMTRNLSHRVDVAFPVLDPEIRQELRRILDLQIADNVKARLIDPEMSNVRVDPGQATGVRAQAATRELLAGVPASDRRTQVTRFEETA
jgi:polyphosphate kinase